jgi:hypothetical protein
MIIKPIQSPLVINYLEKHKIIKEELLTKINSQDSETLESKKENYDDSIHKLDWSKSNDFTRPWVEVFTPFLKENLLQIVKSIGFKKVLIRNIWFQQYHQNNRHGWHKHGCNFTGVYYLELPEGTPSTQICNPMGLNLTANLEAKEGDVVVFPSFVVHRAPHNKSTKRKTIISFNLDFEEPIKGDKND